MKRLSTEARRYLKDFAKSRMSLVEDYESRSQLETAYLARWAIAEKFVKIVTAEYRKDLLQNSLREWQDYLDGKRTKQPQKKPNTALEPNSLPKKQEFIEALQKYGFDGEKIWKIMDWNEKPRKFRNQIAHTGRRFTKQSQYTKLSNNLETVTKIPIGFRT